MTTKRDIIEDYLLKTFKNVRPFHEKESVLLEKYKDGSFGVSSIGFSLYSNGHNIRGKSSQYPFGLIYEDGETLFSLGYFRKELSRQNEDGYLFIAVPKGKNIIEKIKVIVDTVLHNPDLPCKGVYVRFLDLKHYLELLQEGFLPIKESPWHPEAAEEDESYTNSIIDIRKLIETKKKARNAYNRFQHFLERNNLTYTLVPLSESNLKDGKTIIENHFWMLRKQGKDIGSTPEDHYNSLDKNLLKIKSVISYIGYLGNKPVSVFVGERLSPRRFGLYTPFTLREKEYVLKDFNIETEKGFSAISTYSYLEFFKVLLTKEITEVHLGGSELADLNKFKRQLGAKNDPTYWAVLMK